MDTHPSSFYNSLAENQHLIFKDWSASIEWQASIFGPLLERSQPARRLRILDCACGIGTQALGLASRGHFVVATDLSAAAVAREPDATTTATHRSSKRGRNRTRTS